MSAARQLAYSVTEDDEGTGGIIFAKSGVEARRIGAHRFGDGDFNSVRARRAQWADPYAPGPVPGLVLLGHGWIFECAGCLARIPDDGSDDDEPEVPKVPVEVDGKVYCCEACRAADQAERERRREAEAAALGAMIQRVRDAYPNATIAGPHHVYVPRGEIEAKEVVVAFTFPGARIGPAHMRSEDGKPPEVTVCAGDRPAWEAWKKTGYRRDGEIDKADGGKR